MFPQVPAQSPLQLRPLDGSCTYRRASSAFLLPLLTLATAGTALPAQQVASISGGITPQPHAGPLPVRPAVAQFGGCGADCTVVTFEGVGDNQPVGTIAGPVSVTFGANWFGLVDSDAGGSGNFANEPSPDTVAYVTSGAPDPINFSSGINFVEIFYVAGETSIPMTLTAWDGPNGTGNIVTTAVGDVVGNGTNCSGDPTGIFCLWDVVTLTSTGNNIQSITLAGALSDQFAFDSMTFCTSGDSDGDGLLDAWETCGLDINGDGTVDLDLPAMGADAFVPDVFVEIDAMAGRAPTAQDLARVEAAFAAEGIQLHAMLDETNESLVDWTANWGDFDAFKAARFGTAAERAGPNAANALDARRAAFHYCVFANSHSGASSAGLAEVGGNDFFVTLGGAGWMPMGGSADQQCGMFMHLLGHNLGLRDGGADDTAFKPNYPSVMNPTWTLPRVHNAGRWSLDYSSGLLNGLDESVLDETAGLGGVLSQVSFMGPPPMSIIPAFGAVDWDQNGVLGGTSARDVNRLNSGLPATPGEMYADHDDWSSLVFNFRDSSDFATGVHIQDAPAEMTASQNATLDDMCPVPTMYCEGTPSSLGVTAVVAGAGSPTLTGADDFEVVATDVVGSTFGLLVVSLGEDRGAFIGGTLCVEQPFVRTALVSSGGTLGLSDGELRAPISQSFMSSQGWAPGTVVYAQWLNRDFGLANNVGSTPGLVFVVCP